MLQMRKIVPAFVLIFVMMIASSVALASYPTHLGGDSNFILCDGHMGTAWYVDRSSLNVEKYAAPQYIIAVNVVSVNDADRGNTSISRVKTYRFFYNYNLRRMYVDTDGNSNWRYLDPNGSWADTEISMPSGEIAFALAYNLKFYGNRAGYDDAFYNRI